MNNPLKLENFVGATSKQLAQMKPTANSERA